MPLTSETKNLINYSVLKSMKKNSIVISRNSSNNVKIAQETVTSFREIKLTGFEEKFINLFSKNEYKLRISETNV